MSIFTKGAGEGSWREAGREGALKECIGRHELGSIGKHSQGDAQSLTSSVSWDRELPAHKEVNHVPNVTLKVVAQAGQGPSCPWALTRNQFLPSFPANL